MSESFRNGNLHTYREPAKISLSSDESSSSSSSSSTIKSVPGSPEKTDTSCKDTDFKESASDTCKPSSGDDTETENLPSSLSDDMKDEREVADSKESSSDAVTVPMEDESEGVSLPVTDSNNDDQPESEQTHGSVDSYVSDHNDFADNEDSCSTNISKVQVALENLREIRIPREVNIGKVINKRRRKKRFAALTGGKNSPWESLRQGKRLQRAAAEACAPSSDSSQDTQVPQKVIGPTQFSRDLFSKSKCRDLVAGEGPSSAITTQSSDVPLDPSSGDQRPSPTGSSRRAEELRGARRKTPYSLPSTSRAPRPLSPLPPTPEDEAPPPYAGSFILVENLYGNPHACRVNTLSALLDQIVAFSDLLEFISLYPEPDQPLFAASDEGASQTHESSDHRDLRKLQQDFRRYCQTLTSSDVEDKEEASASLIRTVERMKNVSDAESDKYYHSDNGSRIPDSDEPLTIDELPQYLPRLWDSIVCNNMIMNQRTCSLLDWCLKDTPECFPQQFYDTEAGIRNLFRDIAYVHRSINRLMCRWGSRNMYHNELVNLTYLQSLSNTAMTLYTFLEAEVVIIRLNLGTRRTTRRRGTDSEDTLDKGQNQSKESKME